MKRLATYLAVLAIAIGAQAFERPPMSLGVTYDYATEYSQHGFGIKLQAPIGHHVRLEPEFIYCNENKDATTLHLNLNAQYVKPVTERMNIYPFVGVGYSHWGYIGPNANRWGMNLGAGLEYDLGRRWGVLGELRLHAVKQETQIMTTVGLKYNF